MNHAIFVNALICALIVTALYITQNPLCILLIAFMEKLPFDLDAMRIQGAQAEELEEADGGSKSIGFH